ncbi:MAG: methylmalonyl-CoA mutase, partial [Deltaproteobacteria bacterium]
RSHIEAHDRGINYTSKKLVEAGVEVIYAPFRDADEIYKMATEEDVGMIGISCSATNPLYVISELTKLLEEKKAKFSIILGGVIPSINIPRLKEMGIKEVFGPGSDPNAIVTFVKEMLNKEAD